MAKRSFSANSWLHKTSKEAELEDSLYPSIDHSYSSERTSFTELPPLPENPGFTPARYFIPGWSGNSIFSKSAVAIKKIQETIWQDALHSFKENENFPRSLSLLIHGEFVSFLNERSSSEQERLSHFKQAEVFWHVLKNPPEEDEKIIDEFCELYSFRVATNYLFRLKFLVTYSKTINFEYSANHIINPSSFTQQLFRKGSSYEISCEAFKINQYSWYRPSVELAHEIEESVNHFQGLSIPELMKICCFRRFKGSQSTLNFEDETYSHALSHRSFGRFINQLLIFFPIWKGQEKFQYPRPQTTLKPEVLNTLFVGDKVESLGQSHWLAQESYLNTSWSEILCPEFATDNKGNETFIRLGQELQFLTFLVRFSHGKRINSKELLSRVTREKYQKLKDHQLGQFNLFNNKDLAYDRIVLNVSKVPKKNPHHYLIQKIANQKDKLLDDGQLVVMTNQKLFVPSQSKKVAGLLKDYKVECLFNFEKLKGKGEVTNYLYILSKRKNNSKDYFQVDPLSLTKSTHQQESCYTFRVHGELGQFSHFETLVDGVQNFFEGKSSYSTSMYHKHLKHGLSLEFHQDAVIEGKLLSSLTENNDQITHPNFFKNLTKSCLPFESFFHIDDLDAPNRNNLKNRLLGSASTSPQTGSHQILIVDHRDTLYPRIEICPSSIYSAKRQEYGEAFFSYYSITQKVSQFNLNLLRAFFESPIGEQVVQICLRGGQSKLKGRLRSLLIPRFLGEGINIEQSPFANSFLLELSDQQVLDSNPKELSTRISKEIELLRDLKSRSQWAYMSILVHLKMVINTAKERSHLDDTREIDFHNPLIVNALSSLETTCIYPNEEVYTDLLIDKKEDLERPFTKTLLSKGEENFLEVFSGEDILIKFFGEVELLSFIELILSQAKGHSLLSLLQNLHIPKHTELTSLLNNLEDSRESILELESFLDKLISKDFSDSLTQVAN